MLGSSQCRGKIDLSLEAALGLLRTDLGRVHELQGDDAVGAVLQGLPDHAHAAFTQLADDLVAVHLGNVGTASAAAAGCQVAVTPTSVTSAEWLLSASLGWSPAADPAAGCAAVACFTVVHRADGSRAGATVRQVFPQFRSDLFGKRAEEVGGQALHAGSILLRSWRVNLASRMPCRLVLLRRALRDTSYRARGKPAIRGLLSQDRAMSAFLPSPAPKAVSAASGRRSSWPAFPAFRRPNSCPRATISFDWPPTLRRHPTAVAADLGPFGVFPDSQILTLPIFLL